MIYDDDDFHLLKSTIRLQLGNFLLRLEKIIRQYQILKTRENMQNVGKVDGKNNDQGEDDDDDDDQGEQLMQGHRSLVRRPGAK